MKALELVSYNDLQYRDIPAPEPKADELLVRVRQVGICGSDVHGLDGSTGRRIPPVVMGHETSGDVAAAGSACRRFKEGDRVTMDSTLNCGECHYCREGATNLCVNRRVLGVSCDEYRQNGAFAEYVTVPERAVYALPDAVSYTHAAMTEPLSVAVHAVSLMGSVARESALVVGAGVIGLLVLQVLRHEGFEFIAVSDLAPDRLEKAAELGADLLLNPKEQEVGEAVLAATDGLGARAAVDAVGNQASFDSCLAATRRGGFVTFVGNITPRIEIPLQYVVNRQITLQGSCASSGEYPRCLELIRDGAVNLDALISATAPLEEGAAWFKRLYAGETGLFKVILSV